MNQILETFGIQPILLAAQVVNFLILLFILKRFLYKPLLKVLAERKEKISQGLKNAEEIEKRLNKLEEDKEKTLDQAEKQASQIIEEAKKSALSIIEDSTQKAQMHSQELLDKGKELLRQEKELIRTEIRSEIADLVVSTLTKITGKVLTKKDQQQIVDQSIKEI